jgi:uncharacterized membrane protein YhdT
MPLNNKQLALMFAGMIAMFLVGYASGRWHSDSPLWFQFLCVALGSGYYTLTKAIVRLR